VVVLCMGLQVLRQAVDSVGQKCDLHFRRARVSCMLTVFRNDVFGPRFGGSRHVRTLPLSASPRIFCSDERMLGGSFRDHPETSHPSQSPSGLRQATAQSRSFHHRPNNHAFAVRHGEKGVAGSALSEATCNQPRRTCSSAPPDVPCGTP
jgi:hypothetical protein